MSRAPVENWSLTRSLALLAAVFAMSIGALMPFAAMAAAKPGQPVILCSAQGLQTIHVGGLDGPNKQKIGAKCAACVMPLQADLPAPPLFDISKPRLFSHAVVYTPFVVAAPPPARAPPCPPSTAPPHA